MDKIKMSNFIHLELLIDAFKIVTEELEHVKLTIVGGEERRTFTDKLGYLTGLKRKVINKGISDKVEFVGPLYGRNLIRAYKSADIFVYTSLYENFGQTILEAATAGLPIISTRVGVANDLIIDNKTGFHTSFSDPVELSEKILTLIYDENLATKFSKNVRRIVEKEYRWDKIIDKYLTIYSDLL